jgi:tRNA(adenine34) deaminase
MIVNAIEEVASDRSFMKLAIAQAEAAGRLGNVPVGAIVVVDGEVVAHAGNRRDTLQDPTAHAELLALRTAARKTGSWRLEDATLYVTLEPCAMCAGAISHARVGRLVYGAHEPKTGAVRSQHSLLAATSTEIVTGVEETPCQEMLQRFFEALRRR